MRKIILLLLLISLALTPGYAAAQENSDPQPHIIQPGDTWAALAIRYNLDPAHLRFSSGHINPLREPAIGSSLSLPPETAARTGRLIRPNTGGLLAIAVENNLAPWTISKLNRINSPYLPGHQAPIFLPDETNIPVDWPDGISNMELSILSPEPGQAIGLRGILSDGLSTIDAEISGLPVTLATTDDRFVGLVGTGAFYEEKQPELAVQVSGRSIWRQPWQFSASELNYQSLTLTGAAAQIDQQAIDEERQRLREIWSVNSPEILWMEPFTLPINNYLEISDTYGTRRSYNGGPFRSYHEGVDFSAYSGTPVFAPASGKVVIAEPLYVRGGSVIIDHGLGIYTGYYHLSDISVTVGQSVRPGDMVGAVGTTGLSTGNHLHWDFLVNGTWVDALSWLEADLACWVLTALDQPCQSAATRS